jgi:hypothetical protein
MYNVASGKGAGTEAMPPWISSVVFAFLVVVIPYTLIFKILLQLPKPVALSHHRWSLPANVAVIVSVTAWVTFFIHSTYYHRGFLDAGAVFMEFVIAAVAYAFGLVLLVRQFAGMYPEFCVTNGLTGLSVKKTAYRNVIRIDEVAQSHGESHLRLETTHGLVIRLTLPTRDVPRLYERVRPPL